MSTIIYVTDARLPTEKAHGLQIMKTCEALARSGVSVELIAPKRRNHLTDDTFEYYKIATAFPIKKLPSIDLVRFGRIGFLIQEFSFALSLAWALRADARPIYSRDELLVWVLRLFGHRNSVWESHTGGWNFAARAVARGSRSLVVISQGLKDFYVAHGIESKKIVVIPSAIDIEEFANPETKAVARARLGLPIGAKIAMYIGRLDGWKGTDTLLEASRLLPSDIKVVVIGGEALQISELHKKYLDVIFLGYRPYSELPDNQSAADVLVVPNTGKSEISTRFTSPLKLIAHLASNRPIVASDLPSIREIAGDDGALLVPADDSQLLAEGIQMLVADQALSESLVIRARARVIHYTWDARAEEIARIIHE